MSSPIVIPRGTPVHSMGTGRWHISTREQTVHPFHVATYDPDWTVVTWPGSGGYWRRVVRHGDAFVGYWPGDQQPTWTDLDHHEVSS